MGYDSLVWSVTVQSGVLQFRRGIRPRRVYDAEVMTHGELSSPIPNSSVHNHEQTAIIRGEDALRCICKPGKWSQLVPPPPPTPSFGLSPAPGVHSLPSRSARPFGTSHTGSQGSRVTNEGKGDGEGGRDGIGGCQTPHSTNRHPGTTACSKGTRSSSSPLLPHSTENAVAVSEPSQPGLPPHYQPALREDDAGKPHDPMSHVSTPTSTLESLSLPLPPCVPVLQCSPSLGVGHLLPR